LAHPRHPSRRRVDRPPGLEVDRARQAEADAEDVSPAAVHVTKEFRKPVLHPGQYDLRALGDLQRRRVLGERPRAKIANGQMASGLTEVPDQHDTGRLVEGEHARRAATAGLCVAGSYHQVGL
jgi:hypothetical protein